jgi:hypothetical protein
VKRPVRMKKFFRQCLVLLNCSVGLCQPRPELEHRTKACWFVDVPAWRPPPGTPKPIVGLMAPEFRTLTNVEGKVLLGLLIDPQNGPINRSTIVHSIDRYWISMAKKQSLRAATQDEWDQAVIAPPEHGRCVKCKALKNNAGVRYEDWTLVPSHSDKHQWRSLWVEESPDEQWLAMSAWDGFQWRGGDLLAGGNEGSRGYQYFDIFRLSDGKRVATFGGYVESKTEWVGFFKAVGYNPFWLPPHYFVGVFSDNNRSFLFCNPELGRPAK